MWLTAAGLLGLLAGSFANVVIHRVPTDASVIHPASACPGCGAAVRPRDNVPVVSWLLLRGACRDCGFLLSWQYPLVELASAALFVAVAWRFGWDWALPAYLLLAWALLCLAVIDLAHHRLPNRLTYPLAPAVAVLLVAAALLHGDPAAGLRTLAAGLIGFAILLGIAMINPAGMGMGDVKLAASLGLALGYLGWGHLALGLIAAFLLAGLAAMFLLAFGRRGRHDHIPFGPWLAAGTMVAVLFGEPIVAAYAAVAGLA